MKKIFFVGRLVVCGLGLFSCTRAVDTESAKVVIQLPQMATSSAIMSKSSGKVEAVVGAMGVADESLDDGTQKEDFSTIVPTSFIGNTAYPINCYLVAVGGPEAYLNVNFAGKRVNGAIQPNYKFGPYVGLRKPLETIEFVITPGDNRQIFVFGMHAIDIDECKDLRSDRPSKRNFSKPYMIGSSVPRKFSAGEEIVIDIALKDPVQTDAVDDFVFPGDQISLPPATQIAIENMSFPQNTLRKHPSAGFTCEPLDIVLRAGNNAGPGVLSNPINVSVQSSIAVFMPKIYQDYSVCAQDSTAVSSDLSVAISAGQSFKRIWTQVYSSAPSSADLSVVVTPATGLQSISRRFELYPWSENKFEIVAPTSVALGSCNKLTVNYRQLDGQYSPIPSSQDATLAVSSNVSLNNPGVSFHADTSCNSAVTSAYFTASLFTKDVYLLVPAALTAQVKNIYIQAIDANLTPVIRSGGVGINIATSANLAPMLRKIRFNFKNYFKPYTCIPINMDFLDQNGQSMAMPANFLATLIDQSSSVGVFTDSSCTAIASPPATAVAKRPLDLNQTIPVTSPQLFVKGINGSTTGIKYLSFKFSNGQEEKLYFTLLDSNH